MLALDTSALLKRYVEERGTDEVLALMDEDTEWYASALCFAEARVSLCDVGFDAVVLREVTRDLASDWQRFLVGPVDELCLARAAEIGCERAVRTLDAIHLAAAERVAAAARFLTFDERQADTARALGLHVVENGAA
jgi:uncharacterized protein